MKDVFLLFEDTKSSPPTAVLFRNPIAELKAMNVNEVNTVLLQMDEWRKKGHYVAGAAAYEAGFAFIDIGSQSVQEPQNSQLSKKSPLPLLHFYVFENKESVRFEDLKYFQSLNSPDAFIYEVTENICYAQYSEKLIQLKKYFVSGDTYQTNFSLRQRFKTLLNSRDLYRALRLFQKVAYGVFAHFPEGALLSFSPELFFKKEGSELVTKPMKGTAPRSPKPLVDEQNKRFLQTDEKNLAENLMIVDLLRNDLGKIAKPSTVKVENLFEVQSFETLHQMITTISAQIDSEISIREVFKALFPCGSITGAPKIRTMEIISELESEARGIYTGSLGYITPQNDFYFNVAIRTLRQTSTDSYELGLGGGVLVDSTAESEYKECLLKGQFVKKINESFTIFETFLFDGIECRNLQEHLARQEKSCRYFGFPFDPLDAQERLRMFLKGAPNKPAKLKLSASIGGTLSLDAASVGLPTDRPLTVSVSEFRTNSADIFLNHKTSNRHLYDNEGRLAVRDDQYDVLFFNEKDELTEASRHNVFLQLNGEWFTPPLSCGVLPGVQRALTIKNLSAKEKVLSRKDLSAASKIILTNSVRGLVEVKLKSLL